MQLKNGVRIHGIKPEILFALMAAQDIWRKLEAELVVTSVIEGHHSRGSLHYTGNAVDLRINNLSPSAVNVAVDELRECLGDDFDVVLESTHIHIEFDVKQPYGG